MDLKIDGDAMQALVAKSLVDSFTPEQREVFLTNAVAAVLKSSPDDNNGYRGDKRSYLQRAFDSAAIDVVQSIARKRLVEDPDFKSRVESLFSDVAAKVFSDELRDQMVESMANAISR